MLKAERLVLPELKERVFNFILTHLLEVRRQPQYVTLGQSHPHLVQEVVDREDDSSPVTLRNWHTKLLKAERLGLSELKERVFNFILTHLFEVRRQPQYVSLGQSHPHLVQVVVDREDDSSPVTLRNWHTRLLKAERLGLPELKERVLNFILTHLFEVRRQPQYVTLGQSHPHLVQEVVDREEDSSPITLRNWHSKLLRAERLSQPRVTQEVVDFILTHLFEIRRQQQWKDLVNGRPQLVRDITRQDDSPLTVTNWYARLLEAEQLGMKQVKENVVVFVLRNLPEIRRQQRWTDLTRNRPHLAREITERDEDSSPVTLTNWHTKLLRAERLGLRDVKQNVINFILTHLFQIRQQQQWTDLLNSRPQLVRQVTIKDTSPITLTNWYTKLLESEQLGLPELKENVIKFILEHLFEVRRQQHWTNLLKNRPHLAREVTDREEDSSPVSLTNWHSMLLRADRLGLRDLKQNVINFILTHLVEIRRQPQWTTLLNSRPQLVREVTVKDNRPITLSNWYSRLLEADQLGLPAQKTNVVAFILTHLSEIHEQPRWTDLIRNRPQLAREVTRADVRPITLRNWYAKLLDAERLGLRDLKENVIVFMLSRLPQIRRQQHWSEFVSSRPRLAQQVTDRVVDTSPVTLRNWYTKLLEAERLGQPKVKDDVIVFILANLPQIRRQQQWTDLLRSRPKLAKEVTGSEVLFTKPESDDDDPITLRNWNAKLLKAERLGLSALKDDVIEFVLAHMNDISLQPEWVTLVQTRPQLARQVTGFRTGDCLPLSQLANALSRFLGENQCAVGGRVAPDDPVTRVADQPYYNRFPVSESKLRKFTKAAVASSDKRCSDIGKRILQQGGNAIDATVAVEFCIDIAHPQSAGIGGGFFMTYYNRSSQETVVVDAREEAPAAATETMYLEAPEGASYQGGLSVAVPGFVAGLWEAHQRWGVLPWEDLIQPTIDMAHYGSTINGLLARGFERERKQLLNKKHGLNEVYLDKFGNPLREGDVHKRPVLAETLRAIAKNGKDALYGGEVGRKLVQDIRDNGGIVTLADLRNYQVKFRDPVRFFVKDFTGYAPPPPSSGVVVALILNILEGFDFNPDNMNSLENATLMYHRLMESYKYGYAERTVLGDEDYVDVKDIKKFMVSDVYADSQRAKINDKHTGPNVLHYNPAFARNPDAGTDHLSVLDREGNAVSLTSSINTFFGSTVRSKQTGIILNNEMDDFSTPGLTNAWGFQPSPANFIRPGKRPQSSMTPSLFVDTDGNVRLIVGAEGGSKIIGSICYVFMRHMLLNEDLKTAVDARRVYHQLTPNRVEYEPHFPKDILDGLRDKKHELHEYDPYSNVNAIAVLPSGVYANSDWRKEGDPSGF